MANVMATFAQLERRLIAQRTREALQQKKAQGIVLGRPSSLPVEVVARITQERASGATLTQIANSLNDDAVPTAQGGRAWYASTVRKVLLRSGVRDRAHPIARSATSASERRV
jgi:DNA invertase Pin-like site-specific DNA recombinase